MIVVVSVVVVMDVAGIISIIVREGEVVVERENALGECGQFRGSPPWRGPTMSASKNSGSGGSRGGGDRGWSCPLIH